MKRSRFGIGEWFGRSFVHMSHGDRIAIAKGLDSPKNEQPRRPCPFLPSGDCNKAGGVCSIRLYEQLCPGEPAVTHRGEKGMLRAVCPQRFWEANTIFEFVGSTILNNRDPIIVKEVGFLQKVGSDSSGGRRDEVGRIDSILVDSSSKKLEWCALEIQAVYFSGSKMGQEFQAIRRSSSRELPFPVAQRRPDYRSSGPKRLMPQLQIKVPTLRRWGKKMAVVIDSSFFGSIGDMDSVSDISSCDIAWFVMKFESTGERYKLQPDFVHYTTLEDAVEGLTGGVPLTLLAFEERIRQKLNR